MMAPRPPVCLVVLVFLLVGGGGVWLDPTQSITFARERGAKFFISFLDGSSLEGFLGRDIVQMGPYYTEVEFGIVPESGISGHWDHDGILGMGLGEGGELPEPYLFSLSDEDRRGDYRTHVFSPFIFTLVLTDAGGELQIGGYDEQAIDPTRPQIHSFSLIEDEQTGSARYFTVSLAALRLGGVTILNEKAGIPAVVDSGTACFVLPTRHGEAAPYENIYEYFYSNFTSMVQRGQKPSVFLRFHGSTQEIEVPFREFAVGNVPPRPCLTPVTNFDDVILGDPFFRTVIAIHDLTDRGNAQIRFAYRNPSYMLLNTEGATATSSNVSKIALLRKQRGCTGTRMDDEDKIPVEASRNRLSYYADVAIGTPRQERITLLLDTGSSLLAVFALSDVSLSSYFFYVLSFLIVLFVTAMYGLFHWYTKVEKAIFDEQWEEEMEGGANVLESETESDTGDRYVEFEEVPRVPVAVQPVQPPPPITSQDSRTPIFTAQGLELQSTS